MDLKTLMRFKAVAGTTGPSRNLLNVLDYDSMAGMTAGELSNGVIDVASVYADNSSFIRWKTQYAAGTYTISDKITGAGVKNTRLLCSKEFEGGRWNDFYNGYWCNLSNGKLTITVAESFTIGLVLITDTAGQAGKVYDLQFETGSEATPYEPYRE